jgi:hypothetical protein
MPCGGILPMMPISIKPIFLRIQSCSELIREKNPGGILEFENA